MATIVVATIVVGKIVAGGGNVLQILNYVLVVAGALPATIAQR